MKTLLPGLFVLIVFSILFLSCNGNKETTPEAKTKLLNDEKLPVKNAVELEAPDLADPTVKKYYADYTTYLKKVVTTIRNNDEAGTIKLFREEGKQFDNMNDMELKARSTPEEEQKFTSWLMQSYPYQKEVIQSAYYKKYQEEHYKNQDINK